MADQIAFDQFTRGRRVACWCFLGLAWSCCAYLLIRMLALGTAYLPLRAGLPLGSLCRGCDDALMSAAASVRGIPLAAIGLVYFALIAALLIYGGVRGARLALLAVAMGVGSSLLLCFRLLDSIDPSCLVCLVVHVANFGLLVSLFSMVTRDFENAHWLRRLHGPGTFATLVALIVIASGLVDAATLTPLWDSRALLSNFRSLPRSDIPLDASDAVLGPREGRVRLVVFSSFQCPWCQSFASTIHHLHEHFGDRVTIVFKNFPLDSTCNPMLKQKMQPRACAAAWAAEAANLQNGFWRYHDSLFHLSLQDTPETLLAAARIAGLDLNRWQADSQSDSVRIKILHDTILGARLKIDGTPTVFLQGRRVTRPSLIALATLIQDEIDRVD